MGWFKHAFAVDDPDDIDPTLEQKPAVDAVCREIARRHLTMPGLIIISMTRPLNYIGSMTMRIFQPAVWAVLSKQKHDSYVHFAKFLEKRGSMEYLCQRVEHYEEKFMKLQKEQGDRAPGRKRRKKKHRKGDEAAPVDGLGETDHSTDQPIDHATDHSGDQQRDQPDE